MSKNTFETQAREFLRSKLLGYHPPSGREPIEEDIRALALLLEQNRTVPTLAKDAIEVVEQIRSTMDRMFTSDIAQLRALMSVLDSTPIGAIGGGGIRADSLATPNVDAALGECIRAYGARETIAAITARMASVGMTVRVYVHSSDAPLKPSEMKEKLRTLKAVASAGDLPLDWIYQEFEKIISHNEETPT